MEKRFKNKVPMTPTVIPIAMTVRLWCSSLHLYSSLLFS